MRFVPGMGIVSLALAAAGMPVLVAGAPAEDAAIVIAQTQPGAVADAREAERLKVLTEQVLQSLDAATGRRGKRETQAARPTSSGDYESLMKALSTLVEQATRQGKTSADILALIEEALANEDEERLNALIEQAGGRVGLRRLLQALVQKAAMKAAADDPYVRALQAEGQATRVQEAVTQEAMARHAPGEMATAETGRTIVVQPGDTLSIIALRVYGKVGKWRDIYRANSDRLQNPDLVPAGMRLRLP